MMEISVSKRLKDSEGLLQLNVTAAIKSGSVTALYGASGSGKTTLLRLITGLERPDEGYLRFEGAVWCDTSKNKMLSPKHRDIGYVSQSYDLFPNLTILENLKFAGSDIDKALISQLMKATGIEAWQRQKPKNLSGGQRQRAALARALAQRPKILLLDEPFSALDMETSLSLQDYLLEIHKEWQLTIIVVSHRIADIYRLSDTVLTMESGSVSGQGTPLQVFAKKRSADNSILEGQILEIDEKKLTLLIESQVVQLPLKDFKHENLRIGDKIPVKTFLHT